MGELVNKHPEEEAERDHRPEDPGRETAGDDARVDPNAEDLPEHIGRGIDLAADDIRKQRDNQQKRPGEHDWDPKKPPDLKRSIHKVWIIFLTHIVYTFI